MGDRDLADILESDDELPNYYDDGPEYRAYLDDNRFDAYSSDSSIDNNRKYVEDYHYVSDEEYCASSKPQNPTQDRIDKQDHNLDLASKKESLSSLDFTIKNDSGETNNKKLIKKGVLNKQDVFCLKCVANLATESTLIWFTKFLMQKDMQADYKFLKSCLVNSSEILKFHPKYDEFKKSLKTERYAFAKTQNFEVVSH